MSALQNPNAVNSAETLSLISGLAIIIPHSRSLQEQHRRVKQDLGLGGVST